MKYLAVNKTGQLEVATCSVPKTEVDECLIEVRAIGINRADLLQKEGKYAPPKGESEILGIEVSGVLVDVGDDSNHWKKGDEVFTIVPGGAYAEYVKVKSSHLFAKPKHWSFTEAASIAETSLTAFQAMAWLGKLKKGQTVLIHAGASGVGMSAIQIAKQIGAKVVVTAGSKEKCDACLSVGADYALNYHTTDFVSWQKQNLPEGFNVIIDCVAGDYVNKNVSVAALDAKIVTLAILGGRFVENLDMAKMLFKRVSIIASTLRNQTDDYKSDLVKDLTSQLSLDEIRPIVYKVVEWQAADEAHQLLAKNENIGKVVLKVS